MHPLYGVFGVDKHMELMKCLRHFYRNTIVKSLILFSVIVQIYSGFKMLLRNRNNSTKRFDQLQLWKGLHLAVFFLIHVCSVLIGRIFLRLDTNLYYGAVGLNSFPFNFLFLNMVWPSFHFLVTFQPYTVKKWPGKFSTGRLSGNRNWFWQWCLVMAILLFGMTNGFQGMSIPPVYNILIGK